VQGQYDLSISSVGLDLNFLIDKMILKIRTIKNDSRISRYSANLLSTKSITDPDTRKPYPPTSQHAMREKDSSKARK